MRPHFRLSTVTTALLVPTLCILLGNPLVTAQGESRPLRLPDGFEASASPPAAWARVIIPAVPLAVGLELPGGWPVASAGLSDMAFLASDPDATRMVFLQTPAPTTVAVSPGTVAELTEAAGIVAATLSPRKVVDVGQQQLGGRHWVWFDLGIGLAGDYGVPNVARRGPPLTKSHLWIFSTVAEGHQVTVNFIIGHLDDVTLAQGSTAARQAGPVFLRMLERMTFARAR